MGAALAMVIMVGLMIAISVHNYNYTHTDHTSCPDPAKLDPDAKIVDFKQGRSSRKSNYIRTTIVFSDGFEFVAFDTEEGWGTIRTTPAMNLEMTNRAIRSHSEAVAKAGQKQ